MTQEQFDTIRWTGQMKLEYNGGCYDIVSVDFEERLIAITGYCAGGDENDLHWIRCEHAELSRKGENGN